MPDNLRDRIAAVICDMDALHAQVWAYDVAGAVIEALGLQKQSQTGEIVNIIEGDNINYSRHRHVTEWAAND